MSQRPWWPLLTTLHENRLSSAEGQPSDASAILVFQSCSSEEVGRITHIKLEGALYELFLTEKVVCVTYQADSRCLSNTRNPITDACYRGH